MVHLFHDRFFLTRLTQDEKRVKFAFAVIGIVISLLLTNSLYLTYQLLRNESQKRTVTQKNIPSIAPTASVIPMSTSSPIPVKVQIYTQPIVKEYFIPFGGGSNQTGDWTDVPGLTAQVNFGNYSNIKEVHFEASVIIPTANESASVRLFNVTDHHPVWYSEITLVNGQFVSSNPIIYDVGTKMYQVQMKTDLLYQANLIQSRLHIILR